MATRSSRLTIGLLTALVTVVVLGGVSAVTLAGRQRETTGVAAPDHSATRSATTSAPDVLPASTPVPAPASNPPAPMTIAAVSVPPPAPPPASTASSAAPSSAAGPSTESDPSTAPLGPSNNLTVQMSPATRHHTRSQDVQQALQSYFDAINQHDYASWTQSVTKALASHQTSAQWLQAYATTVDSSIWIKSLRDDPLQVQIRFTSQQDPDLAPADMKVGCIDWALTYQVAEHDGQLTIGSTVDGSVSYVKC